MKIGITLKPSAYTPEAFAYKKFLGKRGHLVQLDFQNNLINNDINIYFMGVRPFWHTKSSSAPEIHEYQSLSTPPLPYMKDFLKRSINRKPAGRIFLNNTVKENLGFTDHVPYITRDMGVDELFFYDRDKLDDPPYDIVYSGSINNRRGLIQTVHSLAIKGYKILIIGDISNEKKGYLEATNNVTCFGRAKYTDLPDLYQKARFGLNFTPNIFPFNVQTSTKTLEYLASGLQVISNRYQWIEEFCLQRKYQPIWLDELMKSGSPSALKLDTIPNMYEYMWDSILIETGLENFLYALCKRS